MNIDSFLGLYFYYFFTLLQAILLSTEPINIFSPMFWTVRMCDNFTNFSTVFPSYQDNGRVMCVLCNIVCQDGQLT